MVHYEILYKNFRAFSFSLQLTGSGRGRNRRFLQVLGSGSWEVAGGGCCETEIPSCEPTEAIESWLPTFNSTPKVGSLFCVVVCSARDGVSISTEKYQILSFSRGKMKKKQALLLAYPGA